MIETLEVYILSLMLHKQTSHKRAISGSLRSSVSSSTNLLYLFPSLIKLYHLAARNEFLLITFPFRQESLSPSAPTFSSSIDKDHSPSPPNDLALHFILPSPITPQRPGLTSHYATVTPANNLSHKANLKHRHHRIPVLTSTNRNPLSILQL